MIKILKNFINTYKRYTKCYVCIDIHGTILKPTRNGMSTEYYPLAKTVLQMLSADENTKMILWTSSHDSHLKNYIHNFKIDNINFDFINENPECKNNDYACFDNKMYMDVGIDDKFGFNPYIGWPILYVYFLYKNKKCSTNKC